MKALYPPLSYAIFTALSIAALLAIMTVLNVFTDNIQKNYARAQLDMTSEMIRNEILKLYSTNAEGKFKLEIPNDIAGRQYTIELSQKYLNLSITVRNEKIETYRFVNISATMSGESYAPASIEIERTEGNTLVRLV